MAKQLMLPLGLPTPPASTTADADLKCSIRALWTYPDVHHTVLSRHAKMLGAAGELFCDWVFTCHGLVSTAAQEFCAFDREVTYGDHRLKVQSKIRHSPDRGVYRFDVKRGDPRHPAGRKEYSPDDFDILAMIVLHERIVKFTADWRNEQTISFSEIETLRRHPIRSFERALEYLGIPLITQSAPHPFPANAI